MTLNCSYHAVDKYLHETNHSANNTFVSQITFLTQNCN